MKEVDCDEENDTPMFLGLVNDVTDTKGRTWIVYLPLQGKQDEFKVDCGADVTVINRETYASLPVKPKLQAANLKLISDARNKLKCFGTFKTQTRYKGQHHKDKIYVTESNSKLLSRYMSIKLNIITFNLEECGKLTPSSSELFGKIGKMKGEPYKIRLKEDVVPFHISTPWMIWKNKE